MTKFWVQTKAPAGNWADHMGTDDLEQAIQFSKFIIEVRKDTKEVRVVSRTDFELWAREVIQESTLVNMTCHQSAGGCQRQVSNMGHISPEHRQCPHCGKIGAIWV